MGSKKKAEKETDYAAAKHRRQEYEDAVVSSRAKKKIVVAGPGTGKTHLFKKILKGKTKTLTLSFVNALVDDLSLELCGLSTVKTLHAYARGALQKARKKPVRIFPKLAKVIAEDARILLNKKIDFEQLFHNREDSNEHVRFYKKRKDYYGHFGFSAMVFGAVKHFEKNRDKIPIYDQVVVDEFQDFNTLEVSLIDLLAGKSPVLLVGDDDQALYESLKSASTKHIRTRHSEPEYAAFCLPYCSRCTQVIVKAANDIINRARQEGHLVGRIEKPFRYFHHKKKDTLSEKNSHLVYSHMYAAQMPWFIQKNIGEIAKEVMGKFTVLIISPTKNQCKKIVAGLLNKGFECVEFVDKKATEQPTLLDGLKLLLKDKGCNLGSRIVAKEVLNDADFEALVKKSDKNHSTKLSDLLEEKSKRKISQMLKTLRAVRDGKPTQDTEFASLLSSIGVDAYAMATGSLRAQLKSCKSTSSAQPLCNSEIRKIPITVTTIQGSKGLAADYVFISYFDDRYFIKDKKAVSDQEICNFLVALTRARNGVFLVSSVETKPVFLTWIKDKRIREV